MIKLSKSEGIEGKIKDVPEDFIVEEIARNGAVLELGKSFAAQDLGMGNAQENAKFTVFVLQKRDWNTVQALKTVARKVRRGIRSVGFAGTKDKASASTQLCSIFGVKPEELLSVHVKDIAINGAWASDTGIKLGDLSGNRFTITVRDAESIGNIEKINEELNGIFPNYFGEQRFGFRSNNVEVGLAIIRGDFETAAMKFLTDTANEKNTDAIEARKRLFEERDFKKALDYFPQYLKYERSLLEYLSIYPTDYANALRKLPRSLALMFVHSVDSCIFNEEVEQRIRENVVEPNIYGNIVGYDNEINDDEREILGRIGIKQEQFRVNSMPELNCKGAKRLLFAPYNDFSCEKIDDKTARIRFSLQAGSYATVLLNEFLGKNENEPKIDKRYL